MAEPGSLVSVHDILLRCAERKFALASADLHAA